MVRGLLVVFVVVLLALTGVTLWLTRGGEPEMMANALARLEPAVGMEEPIGGPFSLTDQDGHTVTDKDFRGRVMLVFFGFTHCPDVCPVTLATITSVLNHLSPAKAAQVAPVFITVDPARDTPAQLKAFLKDFHPAITGLTGTDAQIAQVAKEYKVYYSAQDHHGAQYGVDHSSMVYIMGKNGEYVGHFSQSDSEQAILEAISARLN